MRRRQVLAGAGFALTPTLTGCITSSTSDDPSPTTTSTSDDPSPPTTNPDRYDDVAVDGETIDCNDRIVEEWYRNDIPPQPIEVQPEIEPSDDTDAWNQHYLGEHIVTTPSLSLAPVDDAGMDLGALYPEEDERPDRLFSPTYFAAVIDSEAELERVLDTEATHESDSESSNGDTVSPTAVDFDESVLVFVKAGSGSSSCEHQWVRAEATDDGIHLYGYRTAPYIQTSDLTPHTSLVEVERPDHDVETVGVSYTEGECRRIRFASEEGGVTPLSADIENAMTEPVTADVTITAGDDVRVDREISVDGRESDRTSEEYRYLGLVADPDEALTVSVDIESLGISRTESADSGTAETVDIRLGIDEELTISFRTDD